jgi:hypothetical protein
MKARVGPAVFGSTTLNVFGLALVAAHAAFAGITGRYVRVEAPTSPGMAWQEIEVVSGGSNRVFRKTGWLTGTPAGTNRLDGRALVDGQNDPAGRGPDIRSGDGRINPWFEVDLQAPAGIDHIVLHGSRHPSRQYLDKGHRLISVLDAARRVVWVSRFDYYDQRVFPKGVYAFEPQADGRAPAGRFIPPATADWAPLDWVLAVSPERRPADADQRLAAFARRDTSAALAALNERFFTLLEPDAAGMEEARRLAAKGKHAKALDAWKRAWFAKMARANAHAADRGLDGEVYTRQADDLLAGLRVTFQEAGAGAHAVRASRFTPGCVHWVDLPSGSDLPSLRAALADTAEQALVNKFGGALLAAYRRTGRPEYLARWAAIMDDWSLNYFADADACGYNASDLFVMIPANHLVAVMEALADTARERPELVDALPAATLARMQLTCMERYFPAYWRQARGTVFNHNTSGLFEWWLLRPYLDEFQPTTRLAREWRQHFERWMTQGSMPDGSMVEIGDEGHFAIPMILGIPLAQLERDRPDWYTPGWRNRALVWYDNLHKHVLRHLSPDGYWHRHGCRYVWERWVDLVGSYRRDTPTELPMLDPGARIHAIPEVRRILDAVCFVTAGRPATATNWWEQRTIAPHQQAHDGAVALLGGERPGLPRIKSDWMPYTGSYYFRSDWGANEAFLAMLAKGAHGGSEPQSPSWSYGLVYHYDYNYPLMRAETPLIDGLRQNPLFGRATAWMPGTKTSALASAQRDPAPFRWHSSPRFDFGEAVFEGAYQNVDSTWDHAALPPGVPLTHGRPVIGTQVVARVRASRQVVQVREARLFVVADTLRFEDEEERSREHRFELPLTLMLSTRQRTPGRPFSKEQLVADVAGKQLRTRNPYGPDVVLHQFAGSSVDYRMGREVKPDFTTYVGRLSGDIGIAGQPVSATWRGVGDEALVTVVSSVPAGGVECIRRTEALNRGSEVAGFHAVLNDGRDLWCQVAARGPMDLACGSVTARAEMLLVISEQSSVTGNQSSVISGIVLGCTDFGVSGISVPISHPDVEFSELNTEHRTLPARRSPQGEGGNPVFTPIFRPVAPVRFHPDRKVFTDSLTVEMTSATPGVEIRYTTDGSLPTRESTLYAGPFTLTRTTEFAARAFRLGADGQPLSADEFEINGTRFAEPTFGGFTKRDLKPAQAVADSALAPGLDYELVRGHWSRLYNELPWMPANASGIVARVMDLSMAPPADYYGVRYRGCLRVPAAGVYTFHAPPEFVLTDRDASYDLRLYVDGEEWDLTQGWHGLGTWSVALQAGLHAFEVHFADARTTPWRASGLWRTYPNPWTVFQGQPSEIRVTGPDGVERPRIPTDWFWHGPAQTGGAKRR